MVGNGAGCDLGKSDSEEAMVTQGDIAQPSCFGCRHVIAILSFLGHTVAYTMRVSTAIAIVPMTTGTHNKTFSPNSSFASSTESTATYDEAAEFDWNSTDKGIILGAFSFGFLAAQIPGGLLTTRWGNKWPLGLGLLLSSLLSIITPPLVRSGGMYAFTSIRVVQGLGEGIMMPTSGSLMAKWLPPFERSKWGGWVGAGSALGSMLGMLGGGQLADPHGGWPAVFYVFGAIGVIWFVFWAFLVFDSPQTHPRISPEEKRHIEMALRQQEGQQTLGIPIPWKAILTSVPVWVTMVAMIGHGWGHFTLMNELPTFMKKVLHYDMKQNSLVSALPYLVMLIVSQITTWLADWLRENRYLSTTMTRRVFHVIAHCIPAAALVAAAYTGSDRLSTVAMLTLAVGASGAFCASGGVSYMDLAPNFTGLITGITNTIANICGLLAPMLVGLLISVKEEDRADKWQVVFFIAAGIYVVDTIIYVLGISGEEQEWNRPPNHRPAGISTVSGYVTTSKLRDRDDI